MADESKISPGPVADSAVSRPRRRWLRYSLRSLFIFTAICAVATYYSNKWYRRIVDEEGAIETLKRGGKVEFSFADEAKSKSTGPPMWFRRLVGKPKHKSVVGVEFRGYLIVPDGPDKYKWADERAPRLSYREIGRSIATFQDVQTVTFNSTWPADECLEDLRRLPVLDKLYLGMYTLKTPESFERLSKLTRLKWLYLDATRMTEFDLKHLEPLVNLEHLTLLSSSIDDEKLATLARSGQLSYLGLGFCRVTGNGFSHLKDLPLDNLEIDGQMLTEDGLMSIAELKCLSRLKISYVNPKVSPTSFAVMGKAKCLKRLVVYDPNRNERDYEGVKSSLPNVEVSVVGGDNERRFNPCF